MNFCVFFKLCDDIEIILEYFCFVKFVNLGLFVGIVKVWFCLELEIVLDNVVSYDCWIIVEVGVEVKELECVVLGNDMLKVFIVGEIIYNSDFYDYEIKYIEGKVDLYILVWVSEVIVIKIKEMVI